MVQRTTALPPIILALRNSVHPETRKKIQAENAERQALTENGQSAVMLRAEQRMQRMRSGKSLTQQPAATKQLETAPSQQRK